MAEGNALGASYASPNVSSYSNPTVNALLASGGGGANAMDTATSNALGVANQAQQLQSGKVTIDQQTYNLHKAMFDGLHQIYQSIMDNPTSDNATWQLGQAVQAGIVDPTTAGQAAGKLASFGGDSAKIKQFALDGANINQSHQEALDQAYGSGGLANTGGSLVSTLTRTGPNAGVTLSGAPAIPVTASPGEKMGGLNTKDPNTGATVFKPNSTLYDAQGNFIGNGSAPSIPVYRGGGAGAPPSQAGGAGPGAPLPPATPAAPVAAVVSAATAGQGGAGGRIPVGYPASSGADSGVQATAPATGVGTASQSPQSGTSAASGPGAMMTPNPQTLPVVTPDMARAATAALRGGQNTPANRNILRGYALQNNLPEFQHMDAFEAQPAGVGVGISIPPQPATGQGGTRPPAAPPASMGGAALPGRQPPAPGAAGGPAAGGFGQGGGGSGVITGLSPGQEASLKAGADTYSALSSDVTNPNGSNSRIFKIDRALDAIRNTTTGRGTAMRQEMLGTLDALPGGIGKLFPGVDPQSITNYDLATKYTNAIAQSSPGALRSDAGQSLAASANASTNRMTQQAATDVLTNQLGQERMNQAQLRAFDAAGLDPGQFPKWSAQWSRNVDPRAFALADMTPDERNAVWSGLKGSARNTFAASVSKAIAGGAYTRADIVNSGAAANGR